MPPVDPRRPVPAAIVNAVRLYIDTALGTVSYPSVERDALYETIRDEFDAETDACAETVESFVNRRMTREEMARTIRARKAAR